jgi:hypothetical protein
MTIPVPQRINNKLTEEFYPLQKEELIKLYEVGLIKSAAYVHFALRLENPFCDRPVQIIPKEFALRWKIPEKSVYRAIARLKELEILNIKSGKLVIDWVRSEKQETEEEEVAVNENPTPKFSEVRNDSGNSQSCEKILRVEKKFSEVRKNSQSCENHGLKPLSDINSGISQTLKNIQTNQTRGEEEKTFFQEVVQETVQEEVEVEQKVVQETVQKTEINKEKNLEEKNESLRQTPCAVTQKKTKIISSSKSSADIPSELIERLEELKITLDSQVRSAIARHDISQAYGAAAHVENTWDTINNPRSVFLYQLPKQPIEKLGSRYSEEILNNIKAQNAAIEEERKDPEHQKKSKEMFAQIRASLKGKSKK